MRILSVYLYVLFKINRDTLTSWIKNIDQIYKSIKEIKNKSNKADNIDEKHISNNLYYKYYQNESLKKLYQNIMIIFNYLTTTQRYLIIF